MILVHGITFSPEAFSWRSTDGDSPFLISVFQGDFCMHKLCLQLITIHTRKTTFYLDYISRKMFSILYVYCLERTAYKRTLRF